MHPPVPPPLLVLPPVLPSHPVAVELVGPGPPRRSTGSWKQQSLAAAVASRHQRQPQQICFVQATAHVSLPLGGHLAWQHLILLAVAVAFVHQFWLLLLAAPPAAPLSVPRYGKASGNAH